MVAQPLWGGQNPAYRPSDNFSAACGQPHGKDIWCNNMARATRSDNWGFPRWKGYGTSREAVKVRLCDREGCTNAGDCPAPKAPNSSERWMFCQEHAAEYNRGWNYFEGLTEAEIAERERRERAEAAGFTTSRHQQWADRGDEGRSGDEMRALDLFDLPPDANMDDIRKAWRALAKETHPDVKPNDAEAAARFQAGQAAFEILRVAEERRSWKG